MAKSHLGIVFGNGMDFVHILNKCLLNRNAENIIAFFIMMSHT